MRSILPKHPEEQNLVKFIDDDKIFKLHHSAMSAWKRMKEAARTEEIHLVHLILISLCQRLTGQLHASIIAAFLEDLHGCLEILPGGG